MQNTNNELVSVIVPVYKVEPYLDRCVASILAQTYPNLEVILVDDGSPDNCPALCDAWAQRDARIRVIHKKNGGLSDARNVGLDAASGAYISFVDSDDYIAENFIETLYDLLLLIVCQNPLLRKHGHMCDAAVDVLVVHSLVKENRCIVFFYNLIHVFFKSSAP